MAKFPKVCYQCVILHKMHVLTNPSQSTQVYYLFCGCIGLGFKLLLCFPLVGSITNDDSSLFLTPPSLIVSIKELTCSFPILEIKGILFFLIGNTSLKEGELHPPCNHQNLSIFTMLILKVVIYSHLIPNLRFNKVK